MRASTVEATDSKQFDGTIEGAVESLLAPAPEENEPTGESESIDSEETSEREVEEVEEVEQPEEDSTDDDDDDQEDEEEAEVAEDTSGPELYTVKVDGKEERVTLEDLKRDYSGTQYVQKGMRDAADKIKEANQIYQLAQQLGQQVNAAYQQVQAGLPQAPIAPSKDQFDADPIGFMEAKLKYDEDKASYDAQMANLQQVATQQQNAAQAQQQVQLEQELETLKSRIPEFSEPEKAAAIRNKLVKTGTEVYGFQEAEIGSVVDHRAILVLHDAMKYRELMASKEKAVTDAKPRATRTVKAGSKKTRSNAKAERDARQKLKGTGRIEDALNLILE